jgi:hypothetical protein
MVLNRREQWCRRHRAESLIDLCAKLLLFDLLDMFRLLLGFDFGRVLTSRDGLSWRGKVVRVIGRDPELRSLV